MNELIVEALRPLAVPIDDLHLDPANARTGHAIDRIAASLAQYGQRKPVVVNRKEGMKIEAGNGTWQAAKALGWTHVAAVVVDDDPMTAVGYGIADNRLGDLSTWDSETLQALLDSLDPDLNLPTGFDEGELDELLAEMDAAVNTDEAGSADADPQIDHDIIDGVIYKPTINKTRSVRFLSACKWDEKKKRQALEKFKQLKSIADDGLVDAMVRDIAGVLRLLIGNVSWITFPPQGASYGRPHLAEKVAQSVAEKLNVNIVSSFHARPRKGSSHPKTREMRGEMVRNSTPLPKGFGVLVDDVATTGSTIEDAINILRQETDHLIGIVWIYENATDADPFGVIDGKESPAGFSSVV